MKKYVIIYILLSILNFDSFSYGADESPVPPAGAIELVTLPKRENVQITIYNAADLTLVRERRNLVLKEGWNWLQYSWSNTLIDPTSLNLEALERKGQIEIQSLVFPPGQKDLGRWLIHSDYNGKVPFEITYLTSGLSWRAFYMGTLSEDEKSMLMQGYVRLTNTSGEDYENSQTRVIAGDIHLLEEIAALAKRQSPYNEPGGYSRAIVRTGVFDGKDSLQPDFGWWKLNDGQGAIAKDSSGRGKDGIVNNPKGGLGFDGAVWVNDPECGVVASFNGNDSTGAYISAGSIPAMNLENDFTWAFWAKVLTPEDGAGDYDVIIGNRNRPAGWSGQLLGYMFIKFTPTAFEYYSNSNEGIDYPNLNVAPESNVWIHHAVVKRANTLTYYRNGVRIAASQLANNIDVTNPFYIGGDAQVERAACYIHDVKLWSRALTNNEVPMVMYDTPYKTSVAQEISSPAPVSTSDSGGDYFLYTIQGTQTIGNQWSKRLPAFKVDNIEVESLYKYDESRYGNQSIRFVKFANDKNHNLGEMPIPNGNLKMYSFESEKGNLAYVGGTNIKNVQVNEEVELNLGLARLVKVKPTIIDFKTENYKFDPNNIIIGWDEVRTWKIEIINTREIPVTIEITRDFGTNFWTLESETPYEKYDATRIRYNLNIEPRTKREIEYTVTTYHGTREDEYDK
ncbi:MAG: hypothetical protein JXA96_15665 [Sedimentisphaerales bacterium]|nr:hypothetical protein [Sedimentisphaerales bacterium]